ncbi:conserved protein, unknown function [Hepatocystis sp. ex Piliocolobus tephrosceles]|nr:conserved protein, unknown function [Hepatocystis sp. ex Piliocolobus tephrosceles]
MEHSENLKRKNINENNLNFEKFKKNAFEIIEYKDKIIRMLCAILEVQGTTTINIKEFISNLSTTDQMKDLLFDSSENDLKSNNKKTSSRKRTLITIPKFKKLKKKNELNIFSSPNKINDELNKEKNFSDSILSSYKLFLTEKQNENKIEKEQINDETFSDIQNISKENSDIETELNLNKTGSVSLINSKSNKSFIDSHKKALENFQKDDANFECTYNCKSEKGQKSSNLSTKINDLNVEQCQLCLMPNTESLHGNFPPLFYKLSCGHVFHLMCIYETVIRRECRKTCCICHTDLSEADKNEIVNKVKWEKKENEKRSKLLFKVMKLQAENNN